ncbi:MAG: hypothetical protein ACUVR8_01665 [Acidobacteriota bacterium]
MHLSPLDEPDLTPDRRWRQRALLAALLSMLAALTWRKWGDPVVDFGCELYVPWQITQGKHLYRDMFWLAGPLAQYGNALAFAVFGVSLTTLIWVNLTLLALLTELIRSYFARCVSPLAGLVAGLLFLSLFAFGQYGPLANYNYITPYRHEPIRGILLSVGALHAATQAWLLWVEKGPQAARRASWWMGISGLLFGGVCLTKLEIALATGLALAVSFVVGVARLGIRRHAAWNLASWFLGGMLVLPVGFVAYLALHMPFMMALRGALGNLATVVAVNPTQQAFYRQVLGLDTWGQHVTDITTACGIAGLVGLIVLGGELWLPRRRLSVVVLGGTLLSGWLSYHFVPWERFAKPFPVFLLLTAAALAYAVRWETDCDRLCRRWLPLLMWNLLALVLIGRLGLAVRLHHYGFVLAFPAFLFLATGVLFVLPALLRWQQAGTGLLTSGVAAGFLLTCVTVHLQLSFDHYEKKTQPVGFGGDQLLTYGPRWIPIGQVVSETTITLDHSLPPEATLLVIPEGITLNYWLRRPSPMSLLSFDPYYLAAGGGETTVVAELERHPPDFIALARRDMWEYGVGWFGEDPSYGRQVMTWVSQRYEVAQVFGEWEDFGIVLFRRRENTSQSTP